MSKGPVSRLLVPGRDGARAQERVGARLGSLTTRGWHVLHAVPLGATGDRVDHVLIGPGGVFTVNSEHHPGRRVWVAERALLVDGQRTDYLRRSREKREEASRLLSRAHGSEVRVQAVLVVLTGSLVPNVRIKLQPEGVRVLGRTDVPRVFRHEPVRMTAEEIEGVYAVASHPETWR